VGHLDDDIARLKRDVSLERLVTAHGVRLRGQAGVLTGLCPFHVGKAATLIVNAKANTFACSKCKAKGGVIEWTMKAHGISRRHAVELLRSDGGDGPGAKTAKGTVRHSTTRKLGGVFTREIDDPALLARVAGFYHDALKTNPKALAFLQGLGLRNGQVVEHFQIGVSDRTLGYRLPATNRKAGAELRGRLQALGILRETGHEVFRGCLTVPIFDADRRLVTIYGHRTEVDTRKHDGPDVWLGGKPIGTFNGEAFGVSREIVVAGSVLDAIALWSAGVRQVVGVVGGLDELAQLVGHHKTERVILALARTPEGNKAAAALSETLSGVGTVEIVRAVFPNGMGALSYVRDTASAEDGLARILRLAEWVSGVRPNATSGALPTSMIDNPARALPATDPSNGDRANEPAADPRPSDDEMVIQLGDRRWRIRGIRKTTPEAMKVNALVSREEVGFHVDVLDLYSARQRAHYVAMAAVEIGADEPVLKKDLGELLLRLEERQERRVAESGEPKKPRELTDAEERAALDLLRDPRLLDRILTDFDACGVVGEHDSKLLGYLAAVSRKLDRPLAVVIQSSSAAGKSALMQAILGFVPEEDRLSFSAMTGQSLFYTGESDLRHKVLSIAEQEGAKRATYALKLL
jgi:DNA primase